MILVVLSTHVELASATAPGRSYCETGEFHITENDIKHCDLYIGLHQERCWLLTTMYQVLVLDLFIVLFQKLDAHPLKKTQESQKFYPHFSLGIKKKKKKKKKLSTFSVEKVKKTFFLQQKMEIPNFLPFLT